MLPLGLECRIADPVDARVVDRDSIRDDVVGEHDHA